MRKKVLRIVVMLLVLVMSAGVLSACSPAGDTETASGEVSITRKPGIPKKNETVSEEEDTHETDRSTLYIVQLLSTKKEKIFLRNLYTGREYVYRYSLTTDFLDKYGDDTSVTEFGPGKVVTITESGSDRTLDTVRASVDVWTYDGIVNYDVDTDRGVFRIGKENYKLTEDTMVFSKDAQVEFSDISEEDTLSVVGLDKEILTVTVTTGHGYLTVINADKFLGSLLCVGTEVYATVTEDMTLTVPEGKYKVTAANNGYGGTKKVKIKRDETTVLDLKDLEGEGPKYCKLTVKSSVNEASIYIDGNEIKEGKKTKVPYGRHTLTVMVEGYDTWQRTLFVNSESAEITVDPTASEEESDEEDKTEEEASTEEEDDTGHEDNDGDGDYDEDDAEVDYLSTINEMISNLSGVSDD